MTLLDIIPSLVELLQGDTSDIKACRIYLLSDLVENHFLPALFEANYITRRSNRVHNWSTFVIFYNQQALRQVLGLAANLVWKSESATRQMVDVDGMQALVKVCK